MEQVVGCGVQGVGSGERQEVEQIFSPDSCSTTPHTLHPKPAPTGLVKIALFLGDGWILATNDRRYHADSLIFSPECQHRWTICWTPGSRLVRMCQSCLAKEEVLERSILEEWLEQITRLKQELIDKAALRPNKAKQLETGIKDKDKQLHWLNAKLASLPVEVSTEPEVHSESLESIEVEIKRNFPPPELDAVEFVEQLEESHELSTVAITKANQTPAVAVDLVETEALSEQEEAERRYLEQQVEQAFYVAGVALKKLRDSRLYRSTHSTFQDYCLDRFGYGRHAANRLIASSEIYQNLVSNGHLDRINDDRELDVPNDPINKVSNGHQNLRKDNCANPILPTNERQVRPLVSLSPTEQIEVWQQAVVEAGNKIPSGRIVQDVVQRIKAKNPMPNPFTVGDVCLLSSKGNPELRSRHNCWCIISEVLEFSCIVQTWLGQVQVKVENLKPLEYSTPDREKMRELCARLNRIDVGQLEETAWVLLFQIAKLQRASLTELEEKLLSAIEGIKIGE